MSKILRITVTDPEVPTDEQEFVLEYETETPTVDEWKEIHKFEDEHVGGRPGGR